MVALDRLALPLSLQEVVEEGRVGVLGLEFLDLEVDCLPQQIDVFTALNNQSDYLLNAH